MTEFEKQYAAYEEERECIWGVASIDDPLVSGAGSLWTMNDICIIHYIPTDEYSIEINSIRDFPNPQQYGPKQYIGELMDKLRDWMISTGKNMDYPVSTYDLFITGANINTRYKSIEELYASFDKLVFNFVNSGLCE